MSLVKLSDIANVTAGQGTPQGSCFSKEGAPFVRAGSLESLIAGKPERELELVGEAVASKHRLKLQPPGTIVFAKNGMSCMKGYVYVLEHPCYVVSHLACIFPKNGNSKYLSYYFKCRKPNRLIKDVAYPYISLADISNILIELHSNKEQVKIVAILDKASELITLRKQQLEKLDLLVKSRFVEMFGNLDENSKGFPLVSLKDCCIINPPRHRDNRLVDGLEVSFVPMAAVSEKGAVELTETRRYEQVKTGFTYFSENDVLFAKITPCMENGKGAIMEKLINGVGFGSTEFHVLRPIVGISNPYWLYQITVFDKFRKGAAMNMTGSAGQKRVPAAYLEKYNIGLPPLPIQNRFADFVRQVDKSKFEIKQSLEKLEKLKKSLMQQYFG